MERELAQGRLRRAGLLRDRALQPHLSSATAWRPRATRECTPAAGLRMRWVVPRPAIHSLVLQLCHIISILDSIIGDRGSFQATCGRSSAIGWRDTATVSAARSNCPSTQSSSCPLLSLISSLLFPCVPSLFPLPSPPLTLPSRPTLADRPVDVHSLAELSGCAVQRGFKIQ